MPMTESCGVRCKRPLSQLRQNRSQFTTLEIIERLLILSTSIDMCVQIKPSSSSPTAAACLTVDRLTEFVHTLKLTKADPAKFLFDEKITQLDGDNDDSENRLVEVKDRKQ